MRKRERKKGSGSYSGYCSLMLIFTILLLMGLVLPPISHDAEAAHVFTLRRDVAALDTIEVEVETDFFNLQSGHELPLLVTVTHLGYPVEGAAIYVTCTVDDVCTFRMEPNLTDENGQMMVYMLAESDEDVVVDVYTSAYMQNYTPDTYILEDIAIEAVEPLLDSTNMIYVGIGSLMAIAAIGATETGKYALLKLLVVPLYTRVRREDVLDHFVRGQIYGYIQSHPGAHYNAIKQELKVNNCTLSHHLRTLELQGYLKSHRDGTYKRFYPTGQEVPRTRGIQLSDLQMCILDAIRQVPGVTQKDIAKNEGITQQSVSYNLRAMVRVGILASERDGVRKRYFIVNEGL